MEQTNPYRLDQSVIPSEYHLNIRTDLTNCTFSGTVLVKADVTKPTDTITCNALDLTISSVSLNTGQTAHEIKLDSEHERLQASFEATIPIGPIEITYEFSGVLRDDLSGYYLSEFRDENDEVQRIATTHFEATNARKAFPCWDEPAFKARFFVSLEIANHLDAYSARGIDSRTDLGDGYSRVSFKPTSPMSSYLLAFVVGSLEASEERFVGEIPVRVVFRPGRSQDAQFAHEVAVFALQWLSDYFEVDYYGDKIDLIAMPDFGIGAMENTGCIIFREALLLVNPETATQKDLARSAQIIAHELAHMWFGNLVTMAWWEGLWLKEAFATFMETLTSDALRPSWLVWEQFGMDRTAAMRVDALFSTRPIEFEVTSPDEAEEMYDVLTYEKGCAVVRMLEQFMGAEVFRQGVIKYINTHSYANTVTGDLWEALGNVCEHDVSAVMNSWIYEPGFPLVTAELVTAKPPVEATTADGEQSPSPTNTSQETISLSQQRFTLLDAPIAETAEMPALRLATPKDTGHLSSSSPQPDRLSKPTTAPSWVIPVEAGVGENISTFTLVEPHSITIEPGEPLVLDPQAHGFYRVEYKGELARRIAQNYSTLSVASRFKLVDDTYSLVLANRCEPKVFFDLVSHMRDESALPVWEAAASAFISFAHAASTNTVFEKIGEIWKDISLQKYQTLTEKARVASLDPLEQEVRSLLFSMLGRVCHYQPVIDEARQVVKGHIPALSAPHEAASVIIAAQHGGRSLFDRYWEVYQDNTALQRQRRYLLAMAEFNDAECVTEFLNRAVYGSVRSQEVGYGLQAAMKNRHHAGLVWQFIAENWSAVLKAMPAASYTRFTEGFSWLQHCDRPAIHEFLATNRIPKAEKAVLQSLELLEVRARLVTIIDALEN